MTARLLRGFGLAGVWFVVAVSSGLAIFTSSSRDIVLASHDSVVRPTLDGWVVLHTGPVFPDLRLDSGSPIGIDVELGKTTAESPGELVDRYAFIAGQPEGSVAKARDAVADMAYDAAVRGTLIGLVPVVVWLLVGPARRQELWRGARSRRGIAVGVALVVAGVLVWEPWQPDEPSVDEERTWVSLAEFLDGEVTVPESVSGVEVRSDSTVVESRRLVLSAISTYERSKEFYDEAAVAAGDLPLREPEEGETVVVLVSDRHDNIGMDRVARAIGDRAGATAVFDAGDDTSTGKSWEAFSLDSVSEAFEGYDRYGVAGNHDNGTFVRDYLADRGWEMLDGSVVEGPGGAPLIGADDPRASGLGNWRDETDLGFDEVATRLSDEICAAEERVSTALVHDTDLAQPALERGCVDLVVGGHVHVRIGPDRVEGPEGQVGYSFTTGTTGGAAYAIAIGSKPRRDATVSLITYAEGRPVGIQPVVLQTNGQFVVSSFVPLSYEPAAEAR
ncbi:metallophosphoesterase [Nocardioides euryhalodurans]|uniref:Metallophosphoesterase n=1 Tax=Nocardioides euryhalodurans TaxID=2518370 RepID=A0A4V1BE55_9ACTN|nr:metallophosphoesterase [Nocardioides euryhalodurans]QBR93442.1 metallophosphoesterase [Nocardioides euryhalodurans]